MNQKGFGHLYRKLFGIYSAIILAVVLILMAFFLGITRSRVLETNLDYMKMMQEKSVSYLTECSERTDNILEELYKSQDILEELLFYFQNEDEEYQKYRLDRYAQMSSLDYNGFDDYAKKALKSNRNMRHIDFLAYGKGELTSCFSNGNVYHKSLSQEETDKILAGDFAGKEEFGFLKEIRDPETMENAGCMIIMYSAVPFADYKEYYEKPDIFVANQNGTVVSDSRGNTDAAALEETEKEGKPEEAVSSYVSKGAVKDYSVYTFLDKKAAGKLPGSLIVMIIAIGIGVTLLGEALVYWYLNRLAKRLDYILNGMQKVMTGKLDVRLAAAQNGDELDLISANFNEMCEKLDRYIQKSYLAEIEQRNAEIEILQNQINPHFLYNTLEAIRMKAICNKDRDVAKMLYCMAVIFRSQLKEADVITLVQELHYCKKYLELFEYRYQNKFSFQIDCPEEDMNLPVIKFIVQPILENYFAHGIFGERDGNEICISAEKTKAGILIHVSDNGRGMEEAELLQMNRILEENTDTSKNAIGLLNVNRRLKAVYGPSGGVELKKNDAGGLHVILKVGTGEWDGTKESNAD